jgi:Dolichyl-phosphate-mannose-protein mannosyltransferase
MDNEREGKWKGKRLEAGALFLAAALYFTVSCSIAQIRLLWFDEISTRQVALLGSWSRIVAALNHLMDQQPPFFHLLTFQVRNIGGEEIGLRLPAILGFTCAGISLYLIARRWFSPGYAMAAALTPAILFFGALGMEARPYGLVLGCASAALLGWTYRDRWPAAGRVGYLAGILAAGSAHYYGFIIAAPFGIAAAWTLWRTRRFDFWTTLGCFCAVLPNLWNLALIRQSIGIYKNGAWNVPGWRALSTSLWGGCIAVLSVVFVAYAVLLLRAKDSSLRQPSPPGESIACWIGFTALPVFVTLIAKVASGLFMLRYASMFALGYALLLVYLLAACAKGSRLVGYAAGCGALLAFGCVAAWNAQDFATKRELLAASCDELVAMFDQPEYRTSSLLMGDPHAALQMALYCGDDLRKRIVYGADSDQQLAYIGSNNDTKCMLGLRANSPIAIIPLEEFLRAQQHELLVFHDQRSYLKQYFSDRPEYAGRFHAVKADELAGIYRLDAPPANGSGGAGEK